MKKGLQAFSYTQVASIRIFFGALIILPFSIRSLRKLSKQNVHILAISGLLGNFFPAFLFTFAQTNIPSSVAGILNSLTPFFTLAVGIILFKSRPGILQYLGIFVGLLGAILLISNGNFTSFSEINYYALFIVLATFFYGINGNLIHSKLSALNGIEITSLAFMFIGPLAGMVLFSTDLQPAFQSEYFWPSLIACLALSLFGSVLSLFVFNNLIMHTGAIFASSVTYIIPVFALMWGLFDGETLSFLQGLSMVVIIAGVYLANRRKMKRFGIIEESNSI
jgi:drug/metabolite transporter (DMT)-like permease